MVVELPARIDETDREVPVRSAHFETQALCIDRGLEAVFGRRVVAVSAVVDLEQQPFAVHIERSVGAGGEFESAVQFPRFGGGGERQRLHEASGFDRAEVREADAAGFAGKVIAVEHDGNAADRAAQDAVVFSAPVVPGRTGDRHFDALPDRRIAGQRQEMLVGLSVRIDETDGCPGRIPFDFELELPEFRGRFERMAGGDVAAASAEVSGKFERLFPVERNFVIASQRSGGAREFGSVAELPAVRRKFGRRGLPCAQQASEQKKRISGHLLSVPFVLSGESPVLFSGFPGRSSSCRRRSHWWPWRSGRFCRATRRVRRTSACWPGCCGGE